MLLRRRFEPNTGDPGSIIMAFQAPLSEMGGPLTVPKESNLSTLSGPQINANGVHVWPSKCPSPISVLVCLGQRKDQARIIGTNSAKFCISVLARRSVMCKEVTFRSNQVI